MSEVIITVGIPGSGKSTWAKQQVLDGDGKWIRVNKDDIRAMVHANGKHSKAREALTLSVRDAIISEALKAGKNVIVDDTNLNPVHRRNVERLAAGHRVSEKWFDSSLDFELCMKRNINRERVVPPHVMENMYKDYIKRHVKDNLGMPWPMRNPDGKMAVIFDMDGTLAVNNSRSPYDWFRVRDDEPNLSVCELLRELSYNVDILIMSGRDGVAMEGTQGWLADHKLTYNDIFMRAAGDKRPDWQVKEELYREKVFPKYNVFLCVDDRSQVVRMWRGLGLECWQVNTGNF